MTGLECLNMLPYKIQVQILKNITTQGKVLSGALIGNYENTGQFIARTFLWRRSSEGYQYWRGIKQKCGKSKIKI